MFLFFKFQHFNFSGIVICLLVQKAYDRKTINCWQPNPIKSLESPSDSFLCVHYCMIGDEMQRLELVLVVDDGISLNT